VYIKYTSDKGHCKAKYRVTNQTLSRTFIDKLKSSCFLTPPLTGTYVGRPPLTGTYV